jgi:hypothetical protein
MPITVNNYWWDFVDREDYTQWCGMCFDNNWLTNTGYSALYQDVPNGDWLVRAYPTDSTDVGKTIKIFGLDGYGQRLMEKDSSGTWVDGLTITLAIPYGSTSVYVRQIERVIKQETEKPVFLYAYDPARDMLIDLAKYDPSETNPWYARDRLRTGCCNNLINGTTQTPFSVLALVKLKFIPVVADTDLVLIPSTMALKYAIQSVKYGDSQNADEAMKYMAMAIRELNHVMDNQIPQEDAAINTSFAGYERVGYQSVL